MAHPSASVPDLAAKAIDFENWLAGPSPRNRQILSMLALREGWPRSPGRWGFRRGGSARCGGSPGRPGRPTTGKGRRKRCGPGHGRPSSIPAAPSRRHHRLVYFDNDRYRANFNSVAASRDLVAKAKINIFKSKTSRAREVRASIPGLHPASLFSTPIIVSTHARTLVPTTCPPGSPLPVVPGRAMVGARIL
jgi:hypothetical protein